MDDKPKSETDENYEIIDRRFENLSISRKRTRQDNPHDPFNNILTEVEITLVSVSDLREVVENPNYDEIESTLDKKFVKLDRDINKRRKSLSAVHSASYLNEKLKNVLYEIGIMDLHCGYTYSQLANELRSRDEEEQTPAIKKIIARHDNINRLTSQFIDRLRGLLIPLISGLESKVNEENKVDATLETEIPPTEFKNMARKLLLLEALGFLDALKLATGDDFPSKKDGRILATILKDKETTVMRTLRSFFPRNKTENDKNDPRTIDNLDWLRDTLREHKFVALAEKVDKERNKIRPKNI